jgi:uncharacterized protein
MADEFDARCRRLEEELARLGRTAVAYSGGVDSSVLLHAATAALGSDAAGLIADSPSLPRSELADARAAAEAMGARLEVLATDELADPGYRANAGDRCYFCKSALFTAMETWARAHSFRSLAFGAITDDLRELRPGARAADEFGVVAPLLLAGFSKDDVRRYARAHGLPTAEKPASACLASRIPVGTEVTRERLARVEASEAAIKALGFTQLRVRDHFPRARVEVGESDLARAGHLRASIEALLAGQGYETLELATYRRPVDP